MGEEEKSFIRYRLNRAKEEIEVSKLLYSQRFYAVANSRAYYAIFYAIRAVLALERKDFKKHKDVIAYFNKNYVNTEIFPKKLGHKIAQSQRIREDSDYDEKYAVSSEKTQEQIETAEELIKLVEEYLNSKNI